ncbi:MAG: hypothetical protein R3F07_00015 [Opitutaceae bacterium]
METDHFIRIERVENGRPRQFVVSRNEPGFSLEVVPDKATAGQPAIRKVCVPNSWTGDYHRYSRLIAAAQTFLEQCESLTRRSMG